ncbi:MAG: SpoIID/LytB domain-containing protein [bacterium]|nr:SpoIID/LytB domain-containing protein [bacterium]
MIKKIIVVGAAGMLLILAACTPSKKFLLKKRTQTTVDHRYVRVLLKKTGARVSIKSGSRIRVTEKKTRKVTYDSQKGKLVISPGKIKTPVVIESWNSHLTVNGKPYRGQIELHNVLGKLFVINLLSIDEYLYGVVPSEIPASWPAESLKAQAVAARTYTYYHLQKKHNKRLYDLDATTNFQVYKGVSAEKKETTAAVQQTSGEILSFRYEPILSYFHSTCGGKTINDKYIWSGKGMVYLTGVSCSYCKESPNYAWKTKLSLYEIKRYVGKKYRRMGKIRNISFKKKSGRVVEVKIRHTNGSIVVPGNKFRLFFPSKKIKSMYFYSRKVKDGLILHGHGWGHGVGLCQWGARGMAMKGFPYRRILQHYYQTVNLMQVNRTTVARRDSGNRRSGGRQIARALRKSNKSGKRKRRIIVH